MPCMNKTHSYRQNKNYVNINTYRYISRKYIGQTILSLCIPIWTDDLLVSSSLDMKGHIWTLGSLQFSLLVCIISIFFLI